MWSERPRLKRLESQTQKRSKVAHCILRGEEEITVDDNKSVPGSPVISKMLGLLPKFPPEIFISGPLD